MWWCNRAGRGSLVPSDLYLTPSPILWPTIVESQKSLDEEHVEARIFCMALLQPIDKPGCLSIQSCFEGHPQSSFSLCRITTKTDLSLSAQMSFHIVPNRAGTSKSWTNSLSNGQNTMFHPKNSSLRLPSSTLQRRNFVLESLTLFSKRPEYHRSLFPTGSRSQIKVHCLGRRRVILATNTLYWTAELLLFPLICAVCELFLTQHFIIFDSSRYMVLLKASEYLVLQFFVLLFDFGTNSRFQSQCGINKIHIWAHQTST